MNAVPSEAVAATPSPADIRVGLQGVRAAATLGVVMLHAGVPYASHPMPGLCWAVWDRTGDGVDVIFWSISLFIMPLFLVMSGYFAALTERRHGPRGLLRRRTRRLLRPLAFGLVVLIPVSYSIWMLGWVGDGLTEPIKARSLKFAGGIDRDLYGTAHLWFLMYVFTYVAITAAVAGMARRIAASETADETDRDRSAANRSGRVFSSCRFMRRWAAPIGATSLVVIGAVSVAARPEVVWGFQHAWLPVPSKWIYCGTFFAGGWWLGSRDPELRQIRRVPTVWLAAVAIVAGFTVTLGRWHLGGGDGLGVRVLLPVLSVISAWGVTLATLGAAERWVRRLPRPVEYLAAASLWIYLVHHPIVALVQVDLKFFAVNVPPLLKLAIASGAATLISLLTYEAWGRRSRLGRWLSLASIAASEGKGVEANGPESRRPESNRLTEIGREAAGLPNTNRSTVGAQWSPRARRPTDEADAKRAA